MLAALCQKVFDFAIDGKASRRMFREDQITLSDYVELAGFARSDVGVVTETLLD